jgi:hypothetical protein
MPSHRSPTKQKPKKRFMKRKVVIIMRSGYDEYLRFHQNQTFQSLFPLSFALDAGEVLCQDSEACRMRAALEDLRRIDRLFDTRFDRPVGFCL